MAALTGLLVGLVHFTMSRPAERPTLDFLLLTAIAEFWVATILAGALIVMPDGALNVWMMTAIAVVLIWVGFIAPVLLVTLRFRGMPGPMAAADAVHWLVVLMVQAMVMQSVGLQAPLG